MAITGRTHLIYGDMRSSDGSIITFQGPLRPNSDIDTREAAEMGCSSALDQWYPRIQDLRPAYFPRLPSGAGAPNSGSEISAATRASGSDGGGLRPHCLGNARGAFFPQQCAARRETPRARAADPSHAIS
jgi:hypothetical protein